jgi:hypothetical protein
MIQERHPLILLIILKLKSLLKTIVRYTVRIRVYIKKGRSLFA